MKTNKKKKISFETSETQYWDIKEIADKHNLSFSLILRVLLSQAISQYHEDLKNKESN